MVGTVMTITAVPPLVDRDYGGSAPAPTHVQTTEIVASSTATGSTIYLKASLQGGGGLNHR